MFGNRYEAVKEELWRDVRALWSGFFERMCCEMDGRDVDGGFVMTRVDQ